MPFLLPGWIRIGWLPDNMKTFMKITKAIPSILFAVLACSANFAIAESTNQLSPPSSPSGDVLISRSEFESHFGKPIWTEEDFAQKFFSIYGVELTNFIAQPDQHAKEMVNLSGVAPAAELSEASYHVVEPRIFVDSVPSNTLASLVGLQPGDEILEAYWETAPYGVGCSTLSAGGHDYGWKPSPQDTKVCRLKLPSTALSLWQMNFSDMLHDDRNGLLAYTDLCFSKLPKNTQSITKTKETLQGLFQQGLTGLRIKTQRATLSLSLFDLEHYINGLSPQGGDNLFAPKYGNDDTPRQKQTKAAENRFLTKDELIAAAIGHAVYGVEQNQRNMPGHNLFQDSPNELYKELGFENASKAGEATDAIYNSRYDDFIQNYSVWLPECKNLGAKLHTDYVIKKGLAKDEYDKIVAVSSDISETEMLEGLKFGSVHGEIQHFADGKASLYGGLLSQIQLVKDLRPHATFCVYRGDGIDVLAFYENDSLLFCIRICLGLEILSSRLRCRIPFPRRHSLSAWQNSTV